MLTPLLFYTLKSFETRPVESPKGFDWQGHRGCRGLMPENSIPAFIKALDYEKVVTLELDLAVSKDHQLIVSHEPWFNPAICLQPNGDSIPKTEAEKWLIYQMTVAEIRGYDCGSKMYPRFPDQEKMKTFKPTLREVVEAARAHRPGIRWNIELKSQPEWDGIRHPPVEEFVRLVVAEVRALGIEQTVTLQSFDIRALQALNRQAPDLPLAYLIENTESFEYNLARLRFLPAIYSPFYVLVDKNLVKKCHQCHLKLVPWTVNDVQSMRRLIRLGVDGIITDYPNLIDRVSGS